MRYDPTGVFQERVPGGVKVGGGVKLRLGREE